jgi:hypothetical protein
MDMERYSLTSQYGSLFMGYNWVSLKEIDLGSPFCLFRCERTMVTIPHQTPLHILRLMLNLYDRWYAAGGTFQLAFFSMAASKVKMNANGAHTFLEIVKARFGTAAHLLFTFYAFVTILLVCGSLLRAFNFSRLLAATDAHDHPVGGAATVSALTGMNTIAACFLLPIGIAVYVIFGGLRATFICDWAHTIILFVVIYIFVGNT